MLLGKIDPGEIIGEFTRHDDVARNANAAADQSSYVLEIPRRDPLPVVANDPGCATALARALAVPLRNAVENFEAVALHDSDKRLWLELMYLRERDGTLDPDTGRCRIRHGFSQQDLPDRVGIARMSVNRKLAEGRREELIENRRGVIDIPDPDAFEAAVWRGSM